MIVSVNWLKQFTAIDLPPNELATLIGARLVEIEEVIDLGAKYQDVMVAQVVTCEPIEGSDHLHVTKLDDAGAAKNVERDEAGLIQVVCGAPNVRAGLMVAWLPPGSVVPETYNKAEPFVLEARKLRGVMSSGMIASSRELDLYDDHSGILELDDNLQPGAYFKDVYELNDYLLDIENKSLTHRPDTFGIVGFAREVAGIQGKAFKTPQWLQATNSQPPIKEAYKGFDLTVAIDNPELSDRYQAIVLTAADGKAKSPLHIQTYLARVGVRPISAVVDVTNYLMLLTGQPLHAFDYDKLVQAAGGKADVHVRAARKDETLTLLDGRTISLHPDDIVIAAGDKAVALAGAMGGQDTEIDETTKTIVLEGATFNLFNLRATQMRHGIFSEAITRFTKGQPAELTAPVLTEAVRLLGEYAGAQAATNVIGAYPGKRTPATLAVSIDFITQLLGSHLSTEEAVKTLENVEFTIAKTDTVLHITHPYWRTDIHIPEDIAEEVGRLRGFDEIEPRLPQRDFTAIRPDEFDLFRASIREIFARAGANEVLTYSFVHGDMLTKAAQGVDDSYRITNSISPQLQYYRQTLTPSLLGLIHPNIKQGYDEFALYELNKVHPKPHGLTDEGVPGEVDMLALTLASTELQSGAPYYRAKKMFDFLAGSLGLFVTYAPIQADPGYPVTAPFEYRRSALVSDEKSGTLLGIVGEYKKSVAKAFKLPEHSAGFEIDTRALHRSVQALSSHYVPLSRYPSTERDICFKVMTDISYQQVVKAATEALESSGLETHISPVDIYQPGGEATKNITIRLRLTSHEKTLTSDEVAKIVDHVATSVINKTKATIV